ncbi:DUF6090 family protein [Congregibacter variabilis]|uniref:DUF6090 family protein n=1 Tax=Congregibacter variabilis TaxID=3081200 RepID=A0ABZ0I428_9GAMM|nr:DUF6090 family protein [Congregibacter sp. IMCC43200]
MDAEAGVPVERISRYMRYAVGEILLVVTGILIALYINNWNEQRQQLELEMQYLLALKEEFSSNLERLEGMKRRNLSNLAAAIEMAKHTGPDQPAISDEEFAGLFFGALDNEVQYRPGTGIINEVISSGSLSIISNPRLKKALASLDGMMLKVRFQESEEVAPARRALFDLADSSVSLRRMRADVRGDQVDRGRFLDSNLRLLQSRKFDNLLNRFIATSRYLGTDYYAQLEQQIREIIQIIDEQL